MFVNFLVETTYGAVECAATEATHVSITAGSNGRNRLAYRGQEYHAHVHIRRYAINGEWELTRDEHDPMRESRTAVYLRKAGLYAYGKDEAPPTHRAKIVAEIVAKVSAHLAAHPELLLRAEAEEGEREVESAQREVDELREKLADAKLKLKAAQHRMRVAKLALPPEEQVAADAIEAMECCERHREEARGFCASCFDDKLDVEGVISPGPRTEVL